MDFGFIGRRLKKIISISKNLDLVSDISLEPILLEGKFALITTADRADFQRNVQQGYLEAEEHSLGIPSYTAVQTQGNGYRGLAILPRDIMGAVASRASEVEIPEMIDIPGMPGKAIMKGELTVGLFKQFVDETENEMEGYNADNLRGILADSSKAGDALTYVSLLDARAYAEWLSEKTGRKFRVQTEEEWLAAEGELSGDNWTWTETELGDITFVLRGLDAGHRGSSSPGLRWPGNAVRLVEHKQAA